MFMRVRRVFCCPEPDPSDGRRITPLYAVFQCGGSTHFGTHGIVRIVRRFSRVKQSVPITPTASPAVGAQGALGVPFGLAGFARGSSRGRTDARIELRQSVGLCPAGITGMVRFRVVRNTLCRTSPAPVSLQLTSSSGYAILLSLPADWFSASADGRWASLAELSLPMP